MALAGTLANISRMSLSGIDRYFDITSTNCQNNLNAAHRHTKGEGGEGGAKGAKIFNGRRSNSNQNGAALTLSGHFPALLTPFGPLSKSVFTRDKKLCWGRV